MPTTLTPKAKKRMFWRMIAHRLARQPQQERQRLERIAHEDDVAGLGGDVGAGAADGHADVGAGQGRGVVDAVADHGDRDLALRLERGRVRPG